MTQTLADPADDRPAASPPDPAVPSTAPVVSGPVVSGTTPAVVAVVVLGVALTGTFVVTGGRWEGSAAARVAAVVALIAALTAVLAAVTGHLLVTLPWSVAAGREPSMRRARRGLTTILLAGGLSVVAVLSAGAAALLTPRGDAGGDTEPSMTVQLTGNAGALAVSAVLSFPSLAAGTLLDTSLVGLDGSAERVLLGRTLIRPGSDGRAVARLTATFDANLQTAVVTAVAGKQTCTATFSTVDAAAAPALACRG